MALRTAVIDIDIQNARLCILCCKLSTHQSEMTEEEKDFGILFNHGVIMRHQSEAAMKQVNVILQDIKLGVSNSDW